MKKQNIKNVKGFTIIEVVLVLAIAGLIFMMVFTALPALQRSQRDTQRSTDISRMLTAIASYESNNRGKIPGDDNAHTVAGAEDAAGLKYDGNGPTNGSFPSGTWGYFYSAYLLVGSAGQTDTFADPDGEPYSLNIIKCSTNPAITAGTDCDATAQRYTTSWNDQAEGTNNTGGAQGVNHAINVVLKATCDGEVVKASSGKRKLALVYKKEGGGTVCVNN